MSGSHPDASLVSETTINGAIGPWREEGGWFSDKHETRERENEDTEYNRNRSLGLATLPASSQVLAVQCSAAQRSAVRCSQKGCLGVFTIQSVHSNEARSGSCNWRRISASSLPAAKSLCRHKQTCWDRPVVVVGSG